MFAHVHLHDVVRVGAQGARVALRYHVTLLLLVRQPMTSQITDLQHNGKIIKSRERRQSKRAQQQSPANKGAFKRRGNCITDHLMRGIWLIGE